MPSLSVSHLDVGILLAYVLGTRLLFGWYIARKRRTEDAEGYFLGGRDIPWGIVGLSFYVSNMSGSTFVGLPGSGYLNGIAVYHYEWLPAVILIFFAAFLLPRYLAARVFTAPQFLEKRYGRSSKKVFSAFLLLANIFIDAAAALFAGAMVFQVLFPGVPLWLTILAASLVAGLYITFGGLDAVVLNDAVQAVLIMVGGSAIAVLTFLKIPSWQAVKDAVDPGALHLIQPASDPTMPWPGVISGVLIVGIYFWCTNQFVIQRALGARSLDHGRRGALLAGFLKLPNLFILILPGVMAVVLYPGLERPDMVFPILAFDLLPVGFRGLMLAALAAAILSSLEAILNSASTLLTLDFVKDLRPDLSEKGLVTVGRWATIVFMLLSALWAPQIAHFPNLWQYLQSILSYVTPPVVVVFLGGIFWARGTSAAGLWTLAGGIPLGVAGWIGNEVVGVSDLQFLYAAGVMFFLSALLFVGVSLVTPVPSPERLHGLVWRPQARGDDESSGVAVTEEGPGEVAPPWHLSFRTLATGLLLAAGVLVAWWW
jgi:SSS family solute:Na+ symporter